MLDPLGIVVLAGDRGPADPLCQAAGVPAKVLVPVGGAPVLVRVLDALDRLPGGGARIVSGPAAPALAAAPQLTERLRAAGWRWVAPAASPASSALAAVHAAGASTPLLLTTGDHALLNGAILHEFLAGAAQLRTQGIDLAVGFVPLERVRARFPGARRTALRFRDGEVCTCNLFALLTPAAAGVIDLWQRVERDRKQPWKIVRLLGPLTLLRFLLGRVTLAEALDRLGRIAGARIRPVLLSHPEAAVDVDSIADWELVKTVVAERESA